MWHHGVGASKAPAGRTQPTSDNRCDVADQRGDGRDVGQRSRPQNARQTTPRARFFGDEIGSAAQHPARSRMCWGAQKTIGLAPITLALGLLVTLCAPTSAEAAKPAVGQVVAKMQALYNKTRDFKGSFKQVFTDALYNRKRTSYGYLWVKKPGRMRFEYSYPEKKYFIADGKRLWVYEPRDKQAFKNPLSTKTLSSGLTFLFGSGNLTKTFNAAYATAKKYQLGGPKHLVLKLTPKTPTAQYKFLVIAVRPGDYVVEESMVVSKHNTNHFTFSNLRFDTRVRNGRFRFKPPTGVRVIDGAKMRTRRRPKTRPAPKTP